MVWTVTNRGSDFTTTSETNLSIPSFTPGANKLLVLGIWCQSTTDPTSVSNHDAGSAWAKIASSPNGAWGTKLHLYACITGSSPSANTIDAVLPSGTYKWMVCLEIDGADVSGSAANAFAANSDLVGGSTGNASINFSLAAFAQSTNMTLGLLGAYATATTPVFGTDAGFTIPNTDLEGTSCTKGFFAYDDAEDTAFNMNMTNAIGVDQLGIAIEIKEGATAVTGSGTPSTPLPTLSGTGTVGAGSPDVFDVGGPVNFDLPMVALAGSGAANTPVSGSGALVLPMPTLAGTGIGGVVAGGTGHVQDQCAQKINKAASESMQDALLRWIQAQDVSVTAIDLQDAWMQWMVAEGQTSGTLRDRWFAYLGGLGYTGSLEDRERAYWSN